MDSLTAPKQYEKVYGLNNWGHIGLFRSQSLFQNSSYLLDVGLLTANTAGVLLFNALLPGNLLGCYGWVESPREDLPPEFSDPGDAARLPLFISRNCFKKHSLNQSCKNCGRSETYDLVQNGNPYTVIVEDCISWIFQGKTDSPRDSASK